MRTNRRTWIRLAAVSGLISVVAGAFGAHAHADPAAKELLRTGATYEAVHALATLAWAALARETGNAASVWPPALFLGGSALFSGSLYALALGSPHWVGVITPVGGLMFIGGWAMLALTAGSPPRPAP